MGETKLISATEALPARLRLAEPHPEIMAEAAAELTRLRAALAKLADECQAAGVRDGNAITTLKAALAAAEREKAALRRTAIYWENIAERAEADLAAARDVIENLIIGIGMGWDMDGIVDRARTFLERTTEKLK